MITCPRCKTQLEDGSKFCDNCGTRIPEPGHSQDGVEEKNKVVEGEQKNGESLIDAAVLSHKQKKTLMKIIILITIIGLAAIAAVIIAMSFPAGKMEKEPLNYALYVKDNQIFFTDLSSNETFQLTSRFIDNDDMDELMTFSLEQTFDNLDNYCTLSSDERLVFFPDKVGDKINDDTYGYSLYYKEVDNLNGEAVKIDSSVDYYEVNDTATIITYFKGKDAILCQYDLTNNEREKIDSHVHAFNVSDDGKKMGYYDESGTLFLKYFGEESVEMGKSDSYFSSVTGDYTTFYYTLDGSLYKKVKGEEKASITSDISAVLANYDSGELYYLKMEEGEASLMDYVEDDMKDHDAAISKPESFTYPDWDDYDSDEEYDAACEAFDAVQEEFWNKVARDDLREELSNRSTYGVNLSLYYYDGKQEKKLLEGVDYDEISAYYQYNYASNTPLIGFGAYNYSGLKKMKLSELEGADDVLDYMNENTYSSLKHYVAVKDVVTPIEQKLSTNFQIDSNGKSLYFLANVNRENHQGDLYEIIVSDGVVQQPVLCDSNVYYENCCYVADEQFMYFKNYNNESNKGEIYINMTKIDDGVYPYNVKYYKELERYVYHTNYSISSNLSTLNYFEKGETAKVADGVFDYMVLPNGNTLYLTNYDTQVHKGELYLFKDGEAIKVADDVSGLI